MTRKLEDLLPEKINDKETNNECCKHERCKGYNEAIDECHSKLSQAFKDGTICWGLSEVELVDILTENLDKHFKAEGAFAFDLMPIAKAILERIKNDQA